MRRGDTVVITLQGDYGKPRPSLVIQSDLFVTHPSVTILPITSDLRDTPLFRIDIPATEESGLKTKSQVMVDKIVTVPAEEVGAVIGRLDDSAMLAVTRALAVWLGFA